MAQGNNGFGKVLTLYCLMGGIVVLLRTVLFHTATRKLSPKLPMHHSLNPSDDEPSSLRRFLAIPFVPMLIYLVLSWGFMPESPWRSLTSTLAYDVTTAVSGVFLHEIFHGSGNNTCDDQSHRVGSHPLGTLRYNPAEDPYYVSNLDKELDPFLAEVLGDVKFTNIVHIVLESMREDSFPYDENGLLHKHILENETPVKGGTPVTSENLTPFINSLAENTLQWHTMWATIPYTHKSMLGCNPLRVFRLTVDWCGQLCVPVDWTLEKSTGTPYQHCFPEVLRYLNTVSNTEDEVMTVYENKSVRTTDKWENVHVHSSTGKWDFGRPVIKDSGFDAVILAEDIWQLNGGMDYPSTFGYFDDGAPSPLFLFFLLSPNEYLL
jgi:hypothetical protein